MEFPIKVVELAIDDEIVGTVPRTTSSDIQRYKRLRDTKQQAARGRIGGTSSPAPVVTADTRAGSNVPGSRPGRESTGSGTYRGTRQPGTTLMPISARSR